MKGDSMTTNEKCISLKELEKIIKDNRLKIKDFPTTNGKNDARNFNENQIQVLYLAEKYLEEKELKDD